MSNSHTVSFSGKIKIKGYNTLQSQQVQAKNYSLNCHFTKQILQHTPNILIPKNVKFTQNLVSLSDFSRENIQQQLVQTQNREYAIYVSTQNQNDFHNVFGKNYQCVLSRSKQFSLKLNLKHSPSFAFTFDLVDRPKFAKTSKLQNLLSGYDNQNSGIITMDQSGRFLVESTSCQFPAVGIWVRCNDLNEIGVYMRITHFLAKKAGKTYKKFLLKWQKKSCIAFVKINDNEVPQLYFVSWKQINLIQPFQTITNEYEIGQKKEIIVQFSKLNLQFTLRGASNGQQIDFVSPKKDLTKEQFEQQLQKLHLQESPQFSSIKKNHWLEQRTYLLDKVQNQECQIKKLKRQIEKLTNELSKIRNFNSPSEKPLQYFRSPSLLGSASTGNEKFKKLTSNDLQMSNQNGNINLNGKIFESGSTKQKNSSTNNSNSGSQFQKYQKNINLQAKQVDKKIQEGEDMINVNLDRSKYCKQNEKILENEQDPWDMMQIIE